MSGGGDGQTVWENVDVTDPIAIYQAVLDRLSRAALDGDRDIIRRHVRLPLVAATGAGPLTITTEAALMAYCLAYTHTLRQLGATDYIRIARTARFVAPDRIEGLHYTHVIRGSDRIVAPYASRMALAEGAGGWAVVEANHSLAAEEVPPPLPAADGDAPHMGLG